MHVPSFIRSLFRSSPTRTAPATPQAAPRFQQGQLLLARLDAEIDVAPRRRGALIGGSRSRPLAVFTHTRAGAQATGKDRFNLDASWVGRGVMLMSPPAKDGQVVGFAQACVQGNVTQLIDLTSPEQLPRSCMDRPTRWQMGSGGRKLSACFRDAVAPRARHLEADPHYRVATDLGNGATERRVEVALTGPEGERKQGLAWTRWPVHPHQVLQAPLLLKVCQQVASHAPAEDAAVAFQDATGGSVAAAFAAALAMYREHLARPLTPRLLDDAVIQACGQLRANRAPALFEGRPDLLQSLAKFGELLMAEVPVPPRAATRSSSPRQRAGGTPDTQPATRAVGFQPEARYVHLDVQAPVRPATPDAREAARLVRAVEVDFAAKDVPAARGDVESAAWRALDPAWDDQPEEGSDIASSR